MLYRQNSQSREAVKHFEKALYRSNDFARQAAAEELAALMSNGEKLSKKTIKRIRKEAAYPWAEAFEAVDKKSKDKALEFLLNFERGDKFIDELRAFVLREFENKGLNFSEAETAAIEAHYDVFNLRYNEAIEHFRKFVKEPPLYEVLETVSPETSKEVPPKLPPEFLKYPSLINDLGRAFQYTNSGLEGYELFLKWEKNLSDKNARYNLLFFAARIAARRNNNEQAAVLFEQARLFAPDNEQQDACIWYILDLSLSIDSTIFVQNLSRLAPFIRNGTYFDDLFERAFYTLSAEKDWENLIRTFGLIKNNGAVTTAGFAWKIARLIEEEYLSEEELKMAAQAADGFSVSAQTVSAKAFFQLAYNISSAVDSFAQYYHSLSAAALGLPFFQFPLQSAQNNIEASNQKIAVAAFQFLLGFFEHDAAELSPRYVRALENNLSPNELRKLAAAFAEAGMYQQSIGLVFRRINREGYNGTREDMELLYPRPYKDLIEKNAEEHGMTPSLLFGLVRTESAFQNVVVSHAGAVGLTQLIPATAEEMAGRIKRAGGHDFFSADGTLNLNDPNTNIYIGVYYLNYLIGRFDDTSLSLLAYNGGMNRVRRWRAASEIPTDLFLETVPIYETRDYARKVLAAASIYEELYYNEK